MSGRRGFGAIRKLPSKRYQASYIGPDTIRHKAPVTFETREDAEGWLVARRAEIKNEDWTPPTTRKPLTFGEHAETWLRNRTLKPRTRYHYRKLLYSKILPTFKDVALRHMTADLIDDWHYRMGDTTPTSRAHAYGLVRTILGDAVQRRLIDYNPCHIRGAGNAKRVKKIRASEPARARGPDQRDARAVPLDDPARRVVRPPLRGDHRVAPRRYRSDSTASSRFAAPSSASTGVRRRHPEE